MTEEIVCLNTSNASYRLILLHGWGANAQDLIPLGKALSESLSNDLEVISLNAPCRQSQGVGREWYPLFPPDWSVASSAIDHLRSRIQALATEDTPLESSAILGFSQGGAMALASGCDLPVAGLICCSAYAHPGWTPPEHIPPLLLSHGKNDQVVPFQASEKIKNLCTEKGLDANLIPFEGGHEIPIDLLNLFQKNLFKWFEKK